MKNTLFIFLFIWGATALAQTEKIKIKKEEENKAETNYYHSTSLDVIYGQKVFAKHFYRQINTFDSLNTDLPLKFVGVGFSGYDFAVNARSNYGIIMYFNFIIPQQIKIQDTVNAWIKGFSYNLGWGKSFSTPKRRLNLGLFVGFNTGFTKTTSNELGKQVNPFFSPKVAIQPKFVFFKKITFSLIFDCEFDVTNPIWRSFKSAEQAKTIKPFNQTGLSVFATLGYTFV